MLAAGHQGGPGARWGGGDASLGGLKEPEPCLSPHPLQLSALKTSLATSIQLLTLAATQMSQSASSNTALWLDSKLKGAQLVVFAH